MTCNSQCVDLGQKSYNRIPFESDDECGDCGCKLGEYHQPGCDMEKCPVCGGQLYWCLMVGECLNK